MTISSDLGIAQQKATAIASALGTLSGIGKPSLDSQTTVKGNTNAREAVNATLDSGKSISDAVQLATSNLHSVAQGFEAVDKGVRDSLINPLGILK
ncbi:TIGR04197 family type VII secretion effector [uncultured Vagococcus sp.]|uniref:TIGR04197 family type VII secretion effector n=1 Tax=uncultured Vagococcus sp. TaxID=189676 RepID=UPI0028D03222|nr:TIGR04197 family type VII secretion effector [uncultured Vagococcus sp.]